MSKKGTHKYGIKKVASEAKKINKDPAKEVAKAKNIAKKIKQNS